MGICNSTDSSTNAVENIVESGKQEKAIERPQNALTVKVVGCSGLRNADWSWIPGKGLSDAYVIAKAGDKEILRTKTIPNTLEPYFDQEFDVPLLDISADGVEQITFEVFDSDPGKPDDKLGQAALKKDNFMEEGFNGEIQLADAGELNKAYIRVMVKLPDGVYPKGPTAEFKVTLPTKAKNSPVGFEVDTADPSYLLIVSESFKGPAKEHNDKCEAEPTMRLKRMQSIFAVNGISGDASKMEKELKAATEVTLTIRRPQVFTVAVEKKGPFGMGMFDTPVSSLVKQISETKGTCIQVWNEHHAAKEVKAGDRIIEVNGKMGQGKDLTKMLQKDGVKQILVCRPAAPSMAVELWNRFV